MTKKSKPTDLDDIADAIQSLATQVDQRFNKVDKRFDDVEARLANLEKGQRELRDWVERIDNRLLGVESDIKEIYNRIVALEKQLKQVNPKQIKELEQQVAALIEWARQVSKRYDIPMPKL